VADAGGLLIKSDPQDVRLSVADQLVSTTGDDAE